MIRPARHADLPAVAALERQSFSRYQLGPRQLRYLLRRPAHLFLVAVQAGQVIAEAIALVRRCQRRLSGRIYTLAVHRNFQGRGIALKLLKRLLAELAARGAHRVYLQVQHDNHPAIQLYRRLGFRSLGALPHYYGHGAHGVHMVHQVAAPKPFPTSRARPAAAKPKSAA